MFDGAKPLDNPLALDHIDSHDLFVGMIPLRLTNYSGFHPIKSVWVSLDDLIMSLVCMHESRMR
ncbi:unnamed protein product [Fusarium graminearum]|nr:unnamed protein product [Fusarium graminearum]